MNIGRALIYISNKKGLTQRELSKRSGLTAGAHSLIEGGHRDPSMIALRKISKGLELPIPVIFWFSMDEEDMKFADPEFLKYKKQIDELLKKTFKII
jgi:transcriptional regulator with XRE-family HTH domain